MDTVSLLAGLVGPCPDCGNGRLIAVTDGELVNFLCPGCGACWHPELDWVHRVNPDTCPGCIHRDVCQAAIRPYARHGEVVGARPGP